MNIIVLALIIGVTTLFLVWYKGTTAVKAHRRYKNNIDEIKALDISNDLKNELLFLTYESIRPLYLVKVLLGIFNAKKALKIMQKMSDEELYLITKYSIETSKTYLTYAPHWLLIITPLVMIIALVMILFSSIDKLGSVLITPFKNRAIVH